MRDLDLTLPDAAVNLALDEALLLQAEEGAAGEVLRVWEWPALAVVMGSGGRLAEEADETACRADGVPILRRASGGGTVLLGPGCLLYTLILAYERDPALGEIQASYSYILDRISESLGDLLPGAGREGVSDLAAGGMKFSGNAQQRKRRHLLHHGTLLYGFDLPLIARYLRAPPRQPEYRRGREHAAFLCNLPATANELKRGWPRRGRHCPARASWPEERVQRLVAEKYGLEEWIRRR